MENYALDAANRHGGSCLPQAASPDVIPMVKQYIPFFRFAFCRIFPYIIPMSTNLVLCTTTPESLQEYLSEGGCVEEWKRRTGCSFLSCLLKKPEWMVAYRSGMLAQKSHLRHKCYEKWLKLEEAPMSVFFTDLGSLKRPIDIPEEYRVCLISREGTYRLADQIELQREIMRFDREIVKLGLDLKKLGVKVD